MHLTLFTDYALRSLFYLSWHAERPCTVEEISRFYEISGDHVTKVMQHLTRKSYVRSRRGRRGGAMLARPPQEIRLGDLLRDFESFEFLDCMSETGVCKIEGVCRMRHLLGEAQRRMLAYFDEFTLQDLVTNEPEVVSAVKIDLPMVT